MSLLKKFWGSKGEEKVSQASSPPESEPSQINEISPLELKARLDNGDEVVVVDMRQVWEYQYGHIPGALHIFVNEIPARLNELPQDKDIVLQCWHGNTSLQATAYLIEQGWPASQVASLSGGIAGWVQIHGQGSLVAEG
jgi:rhodanese-related sulfurtransferase